MVIIIKRNKKDDNGDDDKKSHTESKKYKSLTKSGGEPPVSPVSPAKTGDSGESGETHSKFVNDSKKSQTSEKLLTREIITGNDGRKVTVEVYDTGAYKETVTGDKIIRERQLKFIIKYKNNVKECVSDCKDAVREIARATHYSPSAKEIMSVINELKEQYASTEEISIVDYVRQKYPDRLEEIEKDPFAWILERTKEIIGYERLKILTFLAVVSSRMERVMGMSRLHIMLVGRSGAGKSSTIKSVLRYIDSTDIYIPGTRFTKNALGYLPIDSFDEKILFLEQIDRQHINYLREMMTEDKICTLVTEKVTDADGNERFESRLRCIPGQAVVITTSVADTIDVNREQIFNRFLKVYVNPRSLDTEQVIRAILRRKSSEISEVDKLVFMAYLFTRPKYADIPQTIEDKITKFVKSLEEYTREPLNRVSEVIRNIIIAVAIARGKTTVTDEDLEFVMSNFQLDILYNGLGLTEGDVEIINLLTETVENAKDTTEIADELRLSKPHTLNALRNLEKKGIVEAEKVNGRSTLVWYLTPLGRKIKSLINNIDNITVTRDESGGVGVSLTGSDSDRKVDSVTDGNSVSRGDADLEEKIKRFEECTGIDIGENAEIIAKQDIVTEDDLMKMFKNQYDVVTQITRCLHELGFVDKGNGVYKKMTGEDKYADFKCTTVWYQRRREELKGKTVKVREIDPDLLFCLKRMKHVEWIDNETIRVK